MWGDTQSAQFDIESGYFATGKVGLQANNFKNSVCLMIGVAANLLVMKYTNGAFQPLW